MTDAALDFWSDLERSRSDQRVEQRTTIVAGPQILLLQTADDLRGADGSALAQSLEQLEDLDIREHPRTVNASNLSKELLCDQASGRQRQFALVLLGPTFEDTQRARAAAVTGAVTVYADIDCFTAYVTKNITTDAASKHVVRALHVLRSELDAVLHTDFAGRKVRFIGDCVHGLLVEGTAQTSDAIETISNMTLCAGGMRGSFDLALSKLKSSGTDASGLALAIGFEYGPMNVTRLGIKGELVRCSASRGVVAAEREQSLLGDGNGDRVRCVRQRQ